MNQKKEILGWREWVGLPELKLPAIKAKVDTGAKTSCLHAFKVKSFTRGTEPWVRFWVHPHQEDSESVVICEAPIADRRVVMDSGGHETKRYVIRAQAVLGDTTVPIELTLTNRDTMKFRMLLGRNALRARYIIDVDQSFCLGGTDTVPPTTASPQDED